MISNWSHVSAVSFRLFRRSLQAAIAFAVAHLGYSVAIAADFPSEGFWMAWQPKHIRGDGEWRAVVHVQKNTPVEGVPGLGDTDESDPWRVSFILIETTPVAPQAEFCRLTFKARITDAVIDLKPEYDLGDGGRLDYTKVDDGLHIQESSVWPESLRKKDLPYISLSQRSLGVTRGGMHFRAMTLTEVTEAAYRSIDRILPRLVPGPIPEGDGDLFRVREILRSDSVIGKSYGEVYAAKLMHLGPKADMVLAQILNNDRDEDTSLRGNAARALVTMDRVKFGPIVLRNLPDLDSVAINEILDGYLYDLEHGRDLPFKAELYDTAVTLLQSWLETVHTPAPERRWKAGGDLDGTSTYLLRLVGMLGAEADIPLLKRLQAIEPSILGTANKWIQMMLTMALARLGEPTALGQIRENLSMELPSPLTTARSRELCNWLTIAGFTQNAEFVPAVCRFLETRPPTRDEPDPSVNAARALDQIIQKRGWSSEPSGTDWMTWWKVHKAKYAK